MQKTAELMRLISVILLSLLLLGWVVYFIPKVLQLTDSEPKEKQSFSEQYSQQLQEIIKTNLEQFLGPDTVKATVRAEVFQSQETIQEEKIIPQSAVLLKHAVSQESYEDKQYTFSTENRTSSFVKDNVYRLSVTVMVDGKLMDTVHGKVYHPRSQREMQTIRAIVQNLIGFNELRGDTLEVVNLPFSHNRLNWFEKVGTNVLIRTFLLTLALILSFMIGIRFILPLIMRLSEPSLENFSQEFETKKEETYDILKLKRIFDTQFNQALDKLKMWLASSENEKKVAVLLLALGEEYIKRVLLEMSDEQVQRISKLMVSCSKISEKEVSSVVFDFINSFLGGGDIYGSKQRVEPILQHTFGEEKAKNIFKDIETPLKGKNVWEKLEYVPTQILVNYLEAEYPQTIALIIYHLSPLKGAEVLSAFPENLKMDILMRLSSLKNVDPETLEIVESTLEEQFQHDLAPIKKKNGKEKLSDILSSMDRMTEGTILQTLYERSPELADALKSEMLVFDQIAFWDEKDIRKILKRLDKDVLVLALKGASDNIKDAFSKCIQVKEWAEIMKLVIKMKSVKIKDIDEAQHKIVRIAQMVKQENEKNGVNL